MTEQLTEAIEIIRDLPEDQQDTIALQLHRLIDLAQDCEIEGAPLSTA